jgi:hypothetical protein
MFKSEKLQVIPSIIHFQAFLDPLPTERVQGGALLARGRADVVEDSVKRKVFFENVLKQFLYLSAPYVEQIYAIEIMNEPIFNTKNVSPTEPHLGNRIIAQDVMRDFLSQACEMIENAGFESTVGHRFFDDCLRYPTGTRAQFHYYPLPDYAQNTIEKVTTHIQIPGFVTEEEHWVEKIFYTPDPLIIPERNAALAEIVAAQAQIRPGWKKNVKNVFVGEFGSDISGDHGGPWPELKGEDRSPLAVVLKRLMLLSNKGYDLALVWPHKGSQATNLDRLSDKMDEDRWFALSTFARGAFK